jgi:phosphopantetheinyl transferase (holo-ACP synthase)
VTARAVGNDVVDLTDPSVLRHHEDAGFVARVCADDERARIGTARDLWALFAAKEAAYKALVKLGASPGFGHRSLRVAPGRASVTWRSLRLELSVGGDDEHVHAVAWSAGAAPTARVVRSDACDGESARARAVLRALVAEHLGCEPGSLDVVREPAPLAWDGFGPPRIARCGATLDVDVSLSHDGRFAAAAALFVDGAAGS